jgi:D-alanyl-D-alanine carboxypeptidase
MRRGRGLSAAVVACLAAAALVRTAAAEPVDLTAQLDAAIESKIAEMGVPGAIVGLSIPGRLDYLRAVGVGDTATGAPMAVDDHVRIGSVTKTFTGTAILQLVDEGRIRLSDPISRYVDGIPSGDAITLDLLGRMRSGLADYTESEAFLDRVYTESPTSPDAFSATPEELVQAAVGKPLEFAPGTQYKYSNTNTALLGLVVKKVTGLSLGDYFALRIFGPLGLTQTSYPPDGLMPVPFAHGYTPLPDGSVVDASLWNPAWADAAGRIVSDYRDLSRWARVLGQGSLLKPETQAQRIKVQEAYPGVGYGFAIFNSHGWLGHNGDIPGYATVSVYLPEYDATLVVFVNSDEPKDHSAGQIATAVTAIATPEHPYNLAR